MALLVHWGLHALFPAKKQTGSSPFVLQEHIRMLEGQASSSDGEVEERAEEVGYVVGDDDKI